MREESEANNIESASSDDFLAGGGEIGALMRAKDWSKAGLGPPGQWPQSLKTAVSICLGSRHPIVIWWGNHSFTQLYNDAYIPFMGATKHPHYLGESGKECWAEIWPTLDPMWRSVLERGESTWSKDLLLVLHRNLPQEEGYFTFSYSPIRDDDGTVGGIFCACSETTERVIGERRLRTLRDLGRMEAEAKSARGACEVAAQTLAKNPADIPFAAIYLVSDDGGCAELAGATGVGPGSAAAPTAIPADRGQVESWLLQPVLEGKAELVTGLRGRFPNLPGGPWPESADAAYLAPIAAPGQARATGVLIAGLSPRRVIDADYKSFIELAAGHIGASVANARAYEEERRRAEALAEIDRVKTAFFSNVSHEFRTPLTLILGPLEDALNSPDHSLDVESLESMHRNSLRLLRLVNTLLDFARIEEHRLQALYQPTDLSALTAEIASAFRSAIEKAGLQLIVDCSELAEPVYVDQEMWEKIVLNLMSNAFKFTQKGQIEVKLRQDGSHARLIVSDTGIGIPTAEIPKLFERFHRVETTQGRTHEGTGIGLALVQELVGLHGGEVSVESVHGQGSVFTVSVPLGSAHLPEERIATAEAANRTGDLIRSFTEEANRWNASELLAADPIHLSGSSDAVTKPARILVVDDNADMREYIARILETRYEVEVAEDGEKALLAINRKRPDLVLSDVMMPRLDGIELLRILRADTRTDSLPVILLSARAGEEAGVEGLQAGADDYLIKPFSARELTARVAAHLRIAQVRDDAKAALHAAYDHEHRIALTFQNALFAIPAEDAFEGLEICGEYESALEEAEVGGDFIDAFALPNGLMALVVGDVSGKGLTAAARTAEIRYTLRSFLRENSRPDETLARLNNALCAAQVLDQDSLDGFTCLALAVLDPANGEISFSCAGAEPPFIVRSSGRAEEIKGTGTPLAVAQGAAYPQTKTRLELGDVMVMVTDGITESRREKVFFGYTRLLEAGERASKRPALRAMAKGILDEAKGFGGRLRDDACVLLARRR